MAATTKTAKRRWALEAPADFPGAGSVPALLRECAEANATRFSLSLPWVQGGFVYATDGRIIARCPCDQVSPEAVAHLEATMGGRRIPLAAEAEFKEVPRLPGEKLPTVPDPMTACCDCGGRGHDVIEDCGLCDDDGTHKGSTCPRCGGACTTCGICSSCSGDGNRTGRARACGVFAGNIMLAESYVWLLRFHRAREVFPAASDPKRLAVYFRADHGLEGLVMPIF